MAIYTYIRKVSFTLVVAILLAAIASANSRPLVDGVSGGTIISNTAQATYSDAVGETFSTISPTVTITVLAVATLTVTPKETAPSANVGPHEHITRLFRICNTGNVVSNYAITRAELNAPAALASLLFDNDASGTVTGGDPLITVGITQSPSVAPGSCIGVLALVDTNDAPPDSLLQIHLTAHANVTGTATGRSEDDGTIINSLGRGPVLSNPTNAALPPLKQINGGTQAVVRRGEPFTYSIAFRNSGDVTARSVVITDDLIAGLEYAPGTLHLENNGGKDLTDAQDGDEGFVRGQHIEVHLPEVVPDQLIRITFNARVSNTAPDAIGLINLAHVAADNAAATTTNTAVVVVDPFGTVFAGRAGASAPIPGASVAVFSDQPLTSLLPLPTLQGLSPNTENVNPFPSDGSGHFSFALSTAQLGTDAAPGQYYIRVQAQGFIPRLIQIDLRSRDSGLFALTERALDAQPLALGGGFALVRDDVAIDNLADLAFNIPMFEEHGLELTKSADKQRAEIGDVVTYRIDIRNPTAATLSDVLVRDRLPDSFHYVPGTARLIVGAASEQAIEPELSGNELLFHVGALAPGATANLLYRIRIGANARAGDADNLAVGTGVFPSGEHSESGTARATVRVGGGVFSTRQVIIGRVFEDVNKNGVFDAGDKPAGGVRLYLTSGQSVITDSEGLYNFPALGEGSQVVSLDPMTLPAGYMLADGKTLSGRSWTRLLRTPIGGGAMLRQNFALVCASCTTSSPLANHSESPTANGTQQEQKSKTVVGRSATNAIASARATESEKNAPPAVAGTYELTSTETIEPIPPGVVQILSPEANSVVMTPAMELTARVTLKWIVRVEVNGEQISEKNIGTSRLDQKNQVATFTFVSVGLRPGPNRVRVTALGPDGAPGRTEELTVMGRGPAQRLEIVPDKTAVQAGGRDSTIVRIKALDKWNHPASDNQVGIESSLGELQRLQSLARPSTGQDGPLVAGAVATARPDGIPQPNAEATKQGVRQLIVPLEAGVAAIRFVGSSEMGEARLHALVGEIEAQEFIRIISETRPKILVGLAEMSFGRSLPEVSLNNEQGYERHRLSFFYSGRLWGNNSLTLAYDSQRPINRTTGHDRLFQFDPLDRVYPLYGDSSTRYEAAQSNSKLYARVDHNRSYAMFGDLDADMDDLTLSGYTRKLTGVKLHLENSAGDFLTVTGARPDTSFARDVFPGGSLSLMQLSHGDILQGSETIAIEVRDRRNPEIILSRELLVRSIDYNLDASTGELFLLRSIPAFDAGLNLTQIVATYEHKGSGMGSSVYTGRARKTFTKWGLKLGFASVLQRAEEAPGFFVGGFDGEKRLPHRGFLRFAWATSQGQINEGVSTSGDSVDTTHDGTAYSVELQQPLIFHEAIIRARFAGASAGFLNPFGSTITPGSRRGEVSFEFKPLRGGTLKFGLIDENNHTTNVDNHRLTFSAAADQIVKERWRFHLGFDHRSFTDSLNDKVTDSNLVTVGAQVQVTEKLDLAAKREQNLGEADPTYPNQTTLSANYKLTQWSKLFFTQRLASSTITPIGDLSLTGFTATNSLHETALGVETRFGKYTSFVGRYQLENGSSGTDSFAVFGLQNRLPVTKEFSLELGFERGFHLAGDGKSFNSATLGLGWTPNNYFKASVRYEFRDRGGNGQLFAIGAAGRITEGITVLSRMRWSHSDFTGRGGTAFDGLAALAIRPLKSDRVGLLFTYDRRSITQVSGGGAAPTRDRLDTLATDGYYQATNRLELYGRFALRFNANGQPSLPFVSTLTFLTQARAQYRLTNRFDWATEARLIFQPSSQTQHTVYGTELGFWAIPDLRFGVGYNFTRAGEPNSPIPIKRGAYFTISSKLSSLFDLFGTSKEGLAPSPAADPPKGDQKR